MAKSDSFYVRAKVDTNATSFAQASIDLGAYVDALGKSVLRIHNVAIQYGSAQDIPNTGINTSALTAFQLTTQSQSAMVDATDKSLIASGKLLAMGGLIASNPQAISEHLDVAPQEWRNGYLVAVEQIYLGVDQTTDILDQVTVVMECTTETLSQAGAMALALSQQ